MNLNEVIGERKADSVARNVIRTIESNLGGVFTPEVKNHIIANFTGLFKNIYSPSYGESGNILSHTGIEHTINHNKKQGKK